MDYYGSISLIDSTHTSQFFGYLGYGGYVEFYDSTHFTPMTGYVVDDSTRLPSDSTYFQGAILSRQDMTLSLKDWTYSGGHLNIDGTWVDGTFKHRWFDPLWLFYSIWSQDYDTSAWSLTGYRYREPVNPSVGEYYASMVVPQETGHYEARWTYLRDNSSYAKEIVQPFVSMSRGIDYMPNYP